MRRQRQARPRALQGEPVHQRLLLVQRLVDAVDLLGRHHVLRHGPLDRADLVVVLLLEDLEGLQEALEGERHIVTGAARRRGHDGGGGHGGSRHADGHVVLAAIHARLDLERRRLEAAIRGLVRRDVFGVHRLVKFVHRQSSSWGQKFRGRNSGSEIGHGDAIPPHAEQGCSRPNFSECSVPTGARRAPGTNPQGLVERKSRSSSAKRGSANNQAPK